MKNYKIVILFVVAILTAACAPTPQQEKEIAEDVSVSYCTWFFYKLTSEMKDGFGESYVEQEMASELLKFCTELKEDNIEEIVKGAAIIRSGTDEEMIQHIIDAQERTKEMQW